MYRVLYSKEADKALRKLDRSVAAMLYAWIDKNLEGTPDPRLHGTALAGNQNGYWRYRVGDYRLIADIRDHTITIHILGVGHRREIYE